MSLSSTNKYVVLDEIKSFFPAQVNSSVDDLALQVALDWAEGEFERMTGSQFNQQTLTAVTPFRAVATNRGALVITALEVGPVTNVTAASYRVLDPTTTISTSWQAITWDNNLDVIYPPTMAPIHPRGWTVSLIPNNTTIPRIPADSLWVRWTYTGGYGSPPAALKEIILRMAQWKYKLREAPLGKVAQPPFGITEIIPSLPADIAYDIRRWQRKGM